MCLTLSVPSYILSITNALFFEPKPMQLQSATRTSAFLASLGT